MATGFSADTTAGRLRAGTTVTAASLAAPPTAPGSLTAPAGPRSVGRYLDETRRWRDDLKAVLGSLDERAQLSSAPDAFTGDLTLAMSLSESIDRRTEDLIRVWDGGRVGDAELAQIAQLTWGRLPDPLGNPTAFSLIEASTLVAALESRLAARLDADPIAGSGVADRIAPLRATLVRCRRLAATLGRDTGEVEQLSELLDSALGENGDAARVGPEVNRILDAADAIERDLITLTTLRASVARDAAELASRVAELTTRQTAANATAELCREKILCPPRLAVPNLAALGPIPPVPPEAAAPGTWSAAHSGLREYSDRLDRAAAALAEAHRRYAAPLAERAELRGLTEAYQAKAGAAGLAEDRTLDAEIAAVRSVLWQAPCDLETARPLVHTYGQAVQAAIARRALRRQTQAAEPTNTGRCPEDTA